MSLKYDRIEYLLSSEDIALAVEGLKNGDKHAKRKLQILVYCRRMSKEDYKRLVQRFYKVNVRKKELTIFGYPIRDYLSLLHYFLCCLAIYIIGESSDKEIGVMLSAGYLALSFFLYHYSNTQDKEYKDCEIAKLKHEIYQLKDIIKDDKRIIELLEKDLEKIRSNLQQE